MKDSNELRGRLDAAIDDTPVIDVHTHLRSYKPHADNVADVLLYHHLGTELTSAGMPATAISKCGLPHECADPEIEPMVRVRNALPYLKHIRNTTVGCFLRTILADLYDVPHGELDESNLDAVAERVASHGNIWQGVKVAVDDVRSDVPEGLADQDGAPRPSRRPRYEQQVRRSPRSDPNLDLEVASGGGQRPLSRADDDGLDPLTVESPHECQETGLTATETGVRGEECDAYRAHPSSPRRRPATSRPRRYGRARVLKRPA